ncbi:MAG TPA: BamA/TamA family outer membrane protein [Gemmatimonadales bacterium]|nr:BamA/TamA family outer membrane protein [Gemmatimonadales bacterium]
MSFTILVAAVLAVQAPSPGDTSGAYLDAEARRLVAASRSRRETIDRSISAYQTTMRERIGVGIRALRRDRLLYRRELALRINWRRDSATQIDVLGARQSVPAAVPKPELPEDLKSDVPDYAFDPADDRLTIGFSSRRDSSSARDSTSDSTHHHDGIDFKHPLAPGSEANYRFASGDSSTVSFPNGRTIRLRELRIIPRRLDVRLLAGSFWIDEESHAVVRALVRPARAFDLERDVEDDNDIPGFVKPIRVEFRFLTIDYALWEGRWWMPRLIAMDAVATAGSFLQMPMRYERVYDDYEVTGDTTLRLAVRPPPPTAAEDSIARAACHKREEAEGVSCQCRDGRCLVYQVNIPTDTAALLASTTLPPPFGTKDDSLISAGDMEALTGAIGKLPVAPWQFQARPPRWGLARFNRVEGLSLGARGELDLGRLRVDGTGRIATTNAALDVEAGVLRERTSTRMRLAGYYRLAAVDPTARSLGLGNSLNALFLGRDDGDYFRGIGAELTISPPVTLPPSFSIRVYAERQRPVEKETDASLPHLFNKDHLFRPNIAADSADQLGGSITFRSQRGIDPERNRWNADVTVDGGAGTFEFARVSSTLRITAPLGRMAAALELGGGMSTGRVPVQSYWYLGGPGTMRGYDGNAQSGDAFWRGRVELGNQWPAARLVLFSDVGSAGSREHLSVAKHLAGIGVGASFLDGLVRIDVTRATRSPSGWRVDFYSDAAL